MCNRSQTLSARRTSSADWTNFAMPDSLAYLSDRRHGKDNPRIVHALRTVIKFRDNIPD
jgi:hypothetical protein